MSDNPLFDASYERLFGDEVGTNEESDAFFSAFYVRFLAKPEISEFFRETDMTRQISMLRRSFFQIAAFYVTCEPSAELERIALIHSRLGLEPSQYDIWLDALIETLRDMDAQCDLSTELAWRWALTPGITYMKLFTRFSDLRST
jgi:hemoglobin-like flavoprotein